MQDLPSSKPHVISEIYAHLELSRTRSSILLITQFQGFHLQAKVTMKKKKKKIRSLLKKITKNEMWTTKAIHSSGKLFRLLLQQVSKHCVAVS